MNCTCHWCKLKIIVDPAQNLVLLPKLQVHLKKVSFWRRPSGFDDLGNFYTTIGIYLGCHNAVVSQAECCDSPYQKLWPGPKRLQLWIDPVPGCGRSLSEWSRGAYRSSDVDENRTGYPWWSKTCQKTRQFCCRLLFQSTWKNMEGLILAYSL